MRLAIWLERYRQIPNFRSVANAFNPAVFLLRLSGSDTAAACAVLSLPPCTRGDESLERVDPLCRSAVDESGRVATKAWLHKEPGANGLNTLDQIGKSSASTLAGKYLIFELGVEEFGVSVMQVREIMKMQQITAVPRAPQFVQGVINLRGRIVPVVNIRRKFELPEQAYTERTCIVVVHAQMDGAEQPVGIIVDGVVEVLLLAGDDIEDKPDFGREAATSYVCGIAKSKGKVKILLDIDCVMGGHDLADLGSISV